MNLEKEIVEKIEKVLRSLNIEPEAVSLEHPADISHGDYSTNVALVYSKEQGQSPRDLARRIVDELEKSKGVDIEKIDIAGPGFINFHLSRSFYTDSVRRILTQGDKFGSLEIGKGKTVIVEYSSPNIAKPFSIGHLRPTIIGDAIANTLSFLGHKVIRDNHLGDWGTQFGKLIYAVKEWGNETEIGRSENPVKELVELYVRFHKEAESDPSLEIEARNWFSKLEKGDSEARSLWKKCIDWSLIEFNKLYHRLNVSFDTVYGESFYEDKMVEVLKDIDKAKIAKKSEGALLVFFPEDKYPPLMILKSDGSTLYATRDLATDKFRLEKYGKDVKIINQVGVEQTLYFKQLFEVEEMLGYCSKDQRVHVGHGHYRFKEGKMSTRKGNVIWLEDILDEAVRRAGEINPQTAEVVGLGAIKFNDLKRESSQDIVFDWDQVLNLKGDSGPYVQYSYVRAISVIQKARSEGIKENFKEVSEELSDLERMLYRFPKVVERAGEEFAPHYIASFIIEIASLYNSYYAKYKIVDPSDPNSSYKVALSAATAHVLKNGLHILGIEVPEKM